MAFCHTMLATAFSGFLAPICVVTAFDSHANICRGSWSANSQGDVRGACSTGHLILFFMTPRGSRRQISRKRAQSGIRYQISYSTVYILHTHTHIYIYTHISVKKSTNATKRTACCMYIYIYICDSSSPGLQMDEGVSLDRQMTDQAAASVQRMTLGLRSLRDQCASPTRREWGVRMEPVVIRQTAIPVRSNFQ